jgi:hypothetical protein
MFWEWGLIRFQLILKLLTELNDPHYTELKTLNLNLDFEFQQLLGSLKHVINIIM